MIMQFTNAHRSTAPNSIFASDRHSTGQFRLETDAFTYPVATFETTTPVANFWKQLIGGSDPPAPEPLLLT